MSIVRRATEGLARKTSRRGLFGRGAQVVTGALFGAAAGTLTRPGGVAAHINPGALTHCDFPIRACPCEGCTTAGPCAKPCNLMTQWYASGCWVAHNGATCCDCDCYGLEGANTCGCGTDYHNNPDNCP